MERYDANVRDGTLHLETGDDSIVVGPMDDICELIGVETYTIEYDEDQRKVAWLDTDADGRLSFDVRDTITEMDYNAEFVSEVESIDAEKTDEEGYPLRASVFADLMQTIWDAKGDL